MSLIASCHCGATQIQLPEHPLKGSECNCTFCARLGAIWSYYEPGELIFHAQDNQRMYSTKPEQKQGYFCATCGMHIWGSSLDWSSLYNSDGTPKSADANAVPTKVKHAVNLRLVDGLDWSEIEIEKMDGRNGW